MTLKLSCKAKNLLYGSALFIILITGCIPQSQTVYYQDHADKKNYDNPYDTITTITDKYFLLPNDYLFVQVSTTDPRISEFFNARSSTGSGMSQNNERFFFYQIDDQMNINFPFAGLVSLKGCNLPMAVAKIKETLKPYLNEANIIVKLANTSFTILGEVRSPGNKNMKKDQITIFEAIAEAGDMTAYGKRKEVRLIRQTPQGEQAFMLDLTDKNIVNSESYYIYPNDLIYIRPMKAKNWGIGESFSLGVISGLIALYLTIAAVSK